MLNSSLVDVATLNSDVKLVKLNSQNAKPAVNDKVTVLGWGVTNPNGNGGVSDKLMTVDVNAISNNDCESHGSGQNSYNGQISDHMLCAKVPQVSDISVIFILCISYVCTSYAHVSYPSSNQLTCRVAKTRAKATQADHSLTTMEYKSELCHGVSVVPRRNIQVSMLASQKNTIGLRRKPANTTSNRLKKLGLVVQVVVVDRLLYHPALLLLQTHHLQALLHQSSLMLPP